MAERVDFSVIKPKIPDTKTGTTGMPDRSSVSKNSASNPIFKDNSVQNSSDVKISKPKMVSDNPILAELGISLDKPLEVTPELAKKLKDRKPKGFWQKIKEGWTNAIPFGGAAIDMAKNINLLSIVKQMEKHGFESLSKEDRETLILFQLEQAEEQNRGTTFWGKVGAGLTHLPAFAVEFALTGGLYSAGAKASQKILTTGLKIAAKKCVEQGVKKAGAKALGALAVQKTVEVAAGSAMRATYGLIHRTADNAIKRQFDVGKLQQDKNGLFIGEVNLKQNQESWVMSAAKGLTDNYIETVSEQSGAMFAFGVTKPLGKLTAKVVGQQRINTIMGKLSKIPFIGKNFKSPEAYKAFAEKTGFHGIVEELGEERFGGFLRGAIALDKDEKTSYWKNLYHSTVPTWEQTGVELATTAIWGGTLRGVHYTDNKFGISDKVKKGAQKIDDKYHITDTVNNGIARAENMAMYIAAQATPFLNNYGAQIPALIPSVASAVTTPVVAGGAQLATTVPVLGVESNENKKIKIKIDEVRANDTQEVEFEVTDDNCVLLYRGLRAVKANEAQESLGHLSNAVSMGENIEEIAQKHGLDLNKPEDVKKLMNYYSGSTQGNDPILHTSYNKDIATNFADNYGCLVTYKIPVEYLQEKGKLAHIGECEIDFLGSVPREFIHKVENIGNIEKLESIELDISDIKQNETIQQPEQTQEVSEYAGKTVDEMLEIFKKKHPDLNWLDLWRIKQHINDNDKIADIKFVWLDKKLNENKNFNFNILSYFVILLSANEEVAQMQLDWVDKKFDNQNFDSNIIGSILASIKENPLVAQMQLDYADKKLDNEKFDPNIISFALSNIKEDPLIAQMQLDWADKKLNNEKFDPKIISFILSNIKEDPLIAQMQLDWADKKLDNEKFDPKIISFVLSNIKEDPQIVEVQLNLANNILMNTNVLDYKTFFNVFNKFKNNYLELKVLEKEEWSKLSLLCYIKERGSQQFSSEEIINLSKLRGTQWNSVIKYQFIKDINIQLSGEELFNIASFSEKFILEKSFKEKSNILKSINSIYEKISDEDLLKELNLEKIKNATLKLMTDTTKPIDVVLDKKRQLFKNSLGITNQETINTIKNLAPICEQYGKTGLPLKYSRETFVQDLVKILEKLPQNQQAEILKKLDIKLTSDKTGYDGLLQFKELNDFNSFEKEMKELVQRFLLNNKVQTGNEEVDKIFNSLIQGMPEFVNIIGKKHHGTHQYTIDVHTIKVLQEALSHPRFNELSNLDKMCLQLSIIFHDLGKSEGVVDTGHEFTSALLTNSILKKFNLPISIKDRISEMVKFHNWYEQINTGKATSNDVAVMFRNPEDLKIAEIFAKSDLMGVSKEFHDSHIANLNEKIRLSREALTKLYQGGNMLFTTRVLNSSLIPRETLNGVEYKVIDFTKISDDTDLMKYGLSVSNKADFRILNHCGDFDVMKALSNPANEAFICTSLISPAKKATFYGRGVGMMLEADNTNIINSCSENQCSGGGRNFDNFVSFTLGDMQIHRDTQSNIFIEKLNLTKEEYVLLYKELLNKKYFGQIQDIKINGRTITKEEIIEAYKAVEEEIMKNTAEKHNEINVYNPKIKGVIFIGDKLEEVPTDALKFAKENDLPIFLMGKR